MLSSQTATGAHIYLVLNCFAISSFIHGRYFLSIHQHGRYTAVVCSWCVCVCVCVCVCARRVCQRKPQFFGESNISRLHWFWNKPPHSCVSSVLLPSLSGLSTHSSFPGRRFTFSEPRSTCGAALRIRFLFFFSTLSDDILGKLRLDGENALKHLDFYKSLTRSLCDPCACVRLFVSSSWCST